MTRLLLTLAVWAVASLFAAVSVAETALKISIRREWEGSRTSAPLSLRAFLKWQRPELLEGRLRVNAFIDETPISRWISPDTALSDSEQVIWFMSPRPIVTSKLDRYILQAEFLGSNRSFDPEQLDVEVPFRGRRAMVVAIVIDHGSSTPTGLGTEGAPIAFERPLALQNFLSAEDVGNLHVYLSRVKPVDVPADSLRFLGLDALLLSHDMLSQLRPAQLDALRVWVLAGGSLALVQTGPLPGGGQEFVDSLSRQEWGTETKQAHRVPQEAQVFSPGLGQFLRINQPLAGDSAEWARVANLLLRIQPLPASLLERRQQLSLQSVNRMNGYLPQNPYLNYRENVDAGTPLEPRPRFELEELTRQLMPNSIRGMPFWLATLVLAGCLLCVGPGDYFLLGMFRRRKWTWVLFPVVALGFTGWMAHLAAEHNGRNDSRTWISVIDVTPQNEVVRTSRLELTYGSSGRTISHEVKDQWWTDLREEDFVQTTRIDPSQQQGVQTSAYNPNPPTPSLKVLGERLSYTGSVPSHHVVEEPVRQWAPRMQRITTLGADSGLVDYPLPQVKWDSIQAGDPRTIEAALNAQLPATWQSAYWRMRSPTFDTNWNRQKPVEAGNQRDQEVLATIGDLVWETPLAAGAGRIQAPQYSGVFSLLTELSPTAAPDCEDLVITSRPTLVLVNEVEPGRYLTLRVVFGPEEK